MTLIVQKNFDKIKVKQWRIGECESGEEEAASKNTNLFQNKFISHQIMLLFISVINKLIPIMYL